MYPLDTTRMWYRYSKVAPINQPVRVVSSEAALIEQPQNYLNPLERFVQVAYQIRYATYRSSSSTSTSDYQVFPVADLNDFSALSSADSRYLKNPVTHNNGYGPLRNQDYLKIPTKITTNAINR